MGSLLFKPLRAKTLYRIECTVVFDETNVKTMNLDLFVFCANNNTIGPLHLYGLRSGTTYAQEHFVADKGSVEHVEVSLRQHHERHVASKFTVTAIDVHEWREKSTRETHFSIDGEVHVNDACGLSILLEPKKRVVLDKRYNYSGGGVSENGGGVTADDMDVV